MENKFKVGDLVECITDVSSLLTDGDKYTIEEVLPNGNVVVFDNGCRCECSIDIFKLAKQKQEPNYMYVWSADEKDAKIAEVIDDLTDNPRCINGFPVVILNSTGVHQRKFAKSIEQWEVDNKPKPLFVNTLNERFFKGDKIYWVRKETNTLESGIIDYYCSYELKESKVSSEIMTKESAEKYIEEHETIEPLSVYRNSMRNDQKLKELKAKYRPFTMEEFKAYRDCWFMAKSGNCFKIEGHSSTAVLIGENIQRYDRLLENFTFEDGTPCGIKK